MRSLDIVRRQIASARIEVAEKFRRLTVSADSGTAQPAFAVQRVRRPTAALKQQQPQPHLCASKPRLGCYL